jgi:hypothetical protein
VNDNGLFKSVGLLIFYPIDFDFVFSQFEHPFFDVQYPLLIGLYIEDLICFGIGWLVEKDGS